MRQQLDSTPRVADTLAPLLLWLLSTPFLHATGLEQAYQSPEGSALGNAVIASVDDASAIHYNVAGLANIEEFQLQVNSLGLYGNARYRNQAGRFQVDDTFQNTGSIFAAAPLSEGLVLGLGVTNPFGLKASYADDHDLRNFGIEGELAHLRTSLGVGWKASRNLELGATLVWAYENFESISGLPRGGTTRFKGDGDAWGYALGLRWTPAPKHRVALNYRSGMDVTSKGKLNDTIPASFQWTYPHQFIFGYAHDRGPWTFEANFQYNTWSDLELLALRLEDGTPLLPQRQDWHDSQFYSVGITYRLDDKTSLRAGYLHGTQAVPDPFTTPLLAASIYNAISAGFSHQFQKLELDATLILNWRKDKDLQKGAPNLFGQTANAIYKTNSVAFHLGTTYRF